MKELTDIDFEILNYISKNTTVTTEDLKRKFSNISNLDQRLRKLTISHKDLPAILKDDFKTEGTGIYSKRIYLGKFSLTDYGNIHLQDYNIKIKKYKKEIWLKNAWIPIIVSFVTTSLTMYIAPMLPRIIKWFVGFLSKTF